MLKYIYFLLIIVRIYHSSILFVIYGIRRFFREFSDTEFSETDFPKPNFPKQIFRQLYFSKTTFSDKRIFQKVDIYNLFTVF